MINLAEFQASRFKKIEPRNALLTDEPNKNPKTNNTLQTNKETEKKKS